MKKLNLIWIIPLFLLVFSLIAYATITTFTDSPSQDATGASILDRNHSNRSFDVSITDTSCFGIWTNHTGRPINFSGIDAPCLWDNQSLRFDLKSDKLDLNDSSRYNNSRTAGALTSVSYDTTFTGLGNSVFCDGTADKNWQYADAPRWEFPNNQFTISAWVSVAAFGSPRPLWSKGAGGTASWVGVYNVGGAGFAMQVAGNIVRADNSRFTGVVNTPYFVVWVYNGSATDDIDQARIYIGNGTHFDNYTIVSGGDIPSIWTDDSNYVEMCFEAGETVGFNGRFDNFEIRDKAYGRNELNATMWMNYDRYYANITYNNRSTAGASFQHFATAGYINDTDGNSKTTDKSTLTFGTAPAAPGAIVNNTVPIINLSYPGPGDTIDNSTLFPFTINGTVWVQNGSILQNITINNTNFKNIRNQTHFNFTFNGTYADGNYNIMLNATSQYGNSTAAYINFTMDLTGPTITASTLTGNRTIFYIGQNITFQINYSDNLKLFHINISTQHYNVELLNINQTTFIYNGSINLTNTSVGKFNLTTSFCDAHTSNSIEEWTYLKEYISKQISFNFDSGYLLIKPENSSLIETFDTEKLKDRYILKYTKNSLNKKDEQSFIVASSEKIEIIGNDNGYYGWLVIPKLQKWVDFNTDSPSGEKYKIKRVNDYTVIVEISGIKTDSFTFYSVGDLNCKTAVYSYYLFNYTAIFSPSVIETTKEIITLQIDFKDIRIGGNGTLNYYDAAYNASNYTSSSQLNLTLNFTIPQVSNNQTNVTLFWNFNLNGSIFMTSNFTQLVERIRLATCGAVTDIRTLNISIFNENLVTKYLEADIAAVFSIWTNDSGNTLNFTFDFRSDTNYSICIYPNTTINADAYIQYNTSGGFNERWYLTNARLTTNTSILYLFNFDTTSGISTLKGTLKDNTFEFFPLVITKLQRYYASENIWRTVQIDRSDDFGLVLFNIIETSTDYRIIFEQNGVELSRTNPSKFKCTSSLCDLTFIVTSASSSTSAKPMFRTGFSNTSNIYQLNFSDTTGLTSSVRLKVTKETGATITTICDTTVTASDGTINCNVTGYDGVLIARVYSSSSPEVAQITEYITILLNKLFQKVNTYVVQKELAFWAMGISTTLTIAGAIFNPIAGIIIYIFSLIVINGFGMLNFITISFITLMASIGVIVGILISKRG